MEDLAAVRRRARFARRRPDPQDLVVRTIAEHADSLLRVARRHTTCQDDAEDAYQRALEIFVRSAHRLDPTTAHRWLHTVCKREAWAVAEARGRLVSVDGETLESLDDARCHATLEERSERFEELTRAAEALHRLKPQEVTALVLKAQGLTYAEIAERQSWTYTKVNRCLAEGRKAFLARYRGIEAGEECERWLPVLSAMADGEATAQQLVDARPHLRNCTACRALLGDLHRADASVAALAPIALAVAQPTGLLDRLGELAVGLQERAVTVHAALETASAAKVAAVAASTVALAGGGVAAERAATPDARPVASASRSQSTSSTHPAAARPPVTVAASRTPTPAPRRPAPRTTANPAARSRSEFAPTARERRKDPSAEFAPDPKPADEFGAPPTPAATAAAAASPRDVGGDRHPGGTPAPAADEFGGPSQAAGTAEFDVGG